MPPDANPFQILTFIAAPAILTNAATVMTLGTSNRLARAIDRLRALGAALQNAATLPEPERGLRLRQLESAERRVLLMMRALSAFYIAVGSFAAATLVSLIGAVVLAAQHDELRGIMYTAGLIAGMIGVAAIVVGAALLVHESRLAWAILKEEIDYRLQSVRE